MRRPSRLTLAATVLVVPLLMGTSCASDDGGVRTENGSGVDGKSDPGPTEDADQVDGQDDEDEG